MANIIEILLKAKDQTSGAFKSATKGMNELDEAAENSAESTRSFGDSWQMTLTAINSGIQIAQMAARAFRQIYEAAKEGAELEMMRGRFDRLSESIGPSSDVLHHAFR